jgi:adenine-specific DNA-methyltransferase
MNQNFKNHIITLLLKDDRLKDEQDELKGNLVKEFVNTLDENLITILLEDEKTREQFFLKIKDAYVFKTNEFKFFLDENSIDNSYTQYSNQIGLSSGGKFLKNNTDIVLDFPFKDCILEGGQSTEDGLDNYFEDDGIGDYIEKQSKRKEIFFNEVLAKDEIDRLIEPKAFTNITKYDSKGESKPTKFNRNAKGTITDNLIIKGNNLLALNSLKQEFKGKVKLIYIDPPYYFTENKDNDSFAYNTNFKLSSWLTFMRNRLVVAKDLLHPEGSIFVQIDDDGQAYLKVLMDNIFKDQFLNTIIVKAKATSGASGGGEDKKIKKNTEYIHVYKASQSFDKFKDQFVEVELKNYIDKLKIEGKIFSYTNVLLDEGEKTYYASTKDGRGDEIKIYKHTNYEIKTVNQVAEIENISVDDVYNKYITKIFTTENAQTSIRGRLLDATDNDNTFYTIEYIPISGKNKGAVTNVSFIGRTKRLVSFLHHSCLIENNKILKKLKLGTLWDDMSWSSVSNEGGVKLKNGKKPEGLLKRIIQMSTSKNDIVLDYHFGSGTTGAAAFKMGRQFIGLEQLDYEDNDSVKRINNVIGGDQTGISKHKKINWKGGGSFIYLELAKNNQIAKEEILKCENLEELLQFFETMYTKYFLHYNVRIKQFKETISKEENFKNLALERQKEIFSKMLDLNQLYVNLSELEDSRYKLDAKDIGLSKDFYQKNK